MDEPRLIGTELVNGWVIERERPRLPGASGGQHSLSYLARHQTGGQAFVKFLDPTIDHDATDPLADLKLRIDIFQYERALIEKCVTMSRIVRALHSGSIKIDHSPNPIFYLIFEMAECDLREQADLNRRFDNAFRMRVLHQVAVGLQQLHAAQIAHQTSSPQTSSSFRATYAILGQRTQAVWAMENALRVAPDHRYALRIAARLFVHVGQPDRALRLLIDSPRTPTDPWLVAPAIAIASIARRSPRFVRRARELIGAQHHRPRDLTEVYGALGTLDYYAGRNASARRSIRASLVAPTENVVAQARWAASKLAGIDITEEAWRVPKSFEAWCWRALNAAQWSQATEYCKQWVEDEPFSSRPATLGSYIGIGLIADAAFSENCARVGLQAEPSDQGLLNNLTVALAYQGKLDDAERTLDKVRPEGSEILPRYVHFATHGLLKFRRGMISAGRDLYQQAARDAPRDKMARVLLYWAREESHARTDQAQRRVREAAEAVARGADPHATRMLELLFADLNGGSA